MKKVFHASELFGEKKEEKALKPIEFTHCLSTDKGWVQTDIIPISTKNVVYLGECTIDGHMFVCYSNSGIIGIYKGHLNDGVIK